MEWTYCLECGAPQFPGDAACPECASNSDPGEAGTTDAPAEPTPTWAGVLRSIWIAQLMAAAGGLLFALGVGFCLGYASRVLSRPATVQRVEPAPPMATQMATAAAVEPTTIVPVAIESRETREPRPAEVAPVEASASEPPKLAAADPKTFVGPPKPPAGPPAEPVDDAWDLEGVRPPPEHWLNLRFTDREPQRRPLPVYEPISPPIQLYGRYLPAPTMVESQWHITTPPEWQGAFVPPPLE